MMLPEGVKPVVLTSSEKAKKFLSISTKNDYFSTKPNELNNFPKALAGPKRIRTRNNVVPRNLFALRKLFNEQGFYQFAFIGITI